MASVKPGRYGSKLVDKNVLVLGGTSGLGFAVAEAAWEFGARVTISGTNQPKIDKKMSEMKSNNPAGHVPKLRGFPCDLGDGETMETNLKSLLDFATENGKTKLDHIVFSAGDAPSFKPLADEDVAHIQASLLVRLAAPVMIAKLCTNHGYLNSSPLSSFTLTSGVLAARPQKGWFLAAAAGGSVEALSRALAVDLAPIRVNTVAPGAIHTELVEKVGGDHLEAFLSSFRERSTTKTVGKPDDTAEAYLYCMRDQFVTGALVETNGGGLLA